MGIFSKRKKIPLGNNPLDKRIIVINKLKSTAKDLKNNFIQYKTKLKELHDIANDIAQGVNKYYDTKCKYRQKAETVANNYKKLSTAYKYQHDSLVKINDDVHKIDSCYITIKPVIDAFMKDRTEFVHYTQKMRQLRAKAQQGKRHAERVKRNEKKLEKASRDFTVSLDKLISESEDCMAKRFKTINKVIVKLYKTDAAVFKKMGENFCPIHEFEESFMDFGGLGKYKKTIFPPIPKTREELQKLVPDADITLNVSLDSKKDNTGNDKSISPSKSADFNLKKQLDKETENKDKDEEEKKEDKKEEKGSKSVPPVDKKKKFNFKLANPDYSSSEEIEELNNQAPKLEKSRSSNANLNPPEQEKVVLETPKFKPVPPPSQTREENLKGDILGGSPIHVQVKPKTPQATPGTVKITPNQPQQAPALQQNMGAVPQFGNPSPAPPQNPQGGNKDFMNFDFFGESQMDNQAQGGNNFMDFNESSIQQNTAVDMSSFFASTNLSSQNDFFNFGQSEKTQLQQPVRVQVNQNKTLNPQTQNLHTQSAIGNNQSMLQPQQTFGVQNQSQGRKTWNFSTENMGSIIMNPGNSTSRTPTRQHLSTQQALQNNYASTPAYPYNQAPASPLLVQQRQPTTPIQRTQQAPTHANMTSPHPGNTIPTGMTTTAENYTKAQENKDPYSAFDTIGNSPQVQQQGNSTPQNFMNKESNNISLIDSNAQSQLFPTNTNAQNPASQQNAIQQQIMKLQEQQKLLMQQSQQNFMQGGNASQANPPVQVITQPPAQQQNINFGFDEFSLV